MCTNEFRQHMKMESSTDTFVNPRSVCTIFSRMYIYNRYRGLELLVTNTRWVTEAGLQSPR